MIVVRMTTPSRGARVVARHPGHDDNDDEGLRFCLQEERLYHILVFQSLRQVEVLYLDEECFCLGHESHHLRLHLLASETIPSISTSSSRLTQNDLSTLAFVLWHPMCPLIRLNTPYAAYPSLAKKDSREGTSVNATLTAFLITHPWYLDRLSLYAWPAASPTERLSSSANFLSRAIMKTCARVSHIRAFVVEEVSIAQPSLFSLRGMSSSLAYLALSDSYFVSMRVKLPLMSDRTKLKPVPSPSTIGSTAALQCIGRGTRDLRSRSFAVHAFHSFTTQARRLPAQLEELVCNYIALFTEDFEHKCVGLGEVALLRHGYTRKAAAEVTDLSERLVLRASLAKEESAEAEVPAALTAVAAHMYCGGDGRPTPRSSMRSRGRARLREHQARATTAGSWSE
eukprot:scaffold364_cov401-Prasinococcus_capsulatus_cf.AAC.2